MQLVQRQLGTEEGAGQLAAVRPTETDLRALISPLVSRSKPKRYCQSVRYYVLTAF